MKVFNVVSFPIVVTDLQFNAMMTQHRAMAINSSGKENFLWHSPYICCLFSISPFSFHLQELFTLQLMLQCWTPFLHLAQRHSVTTVTLDHYKERNKQTQKKRQRTTNNLVYVQTKKTEAMPLCISYKFCACSHLAFGWKKHEYSPAKSKVEIPILFNFWAAPVIHFSIAPLRTHLTTLTDIWIY